MLEIYDKPPLTFDQQFDRLIQRGLDMPDRDAVLLALSSVSYYRLSAYWYPFRILGGDGRPGNYISRGTTFENVICLYEFDRKLRLLVMDAIERIEVAVRTRLTYHMAHQYGAFAHTNAANFHPQFDHDQWLRRLDEEVCRSSDQFLTHYRGKYQGFPRIPVWMITEIMSLGALSFFYKGLRNDTHAGIQDKEAVADHFHIHHKRLGDWLHAFTYIRNVCAHHSRLWNRELAIRAERVKGRQWNPPLTPRNDRIFYVLLILRQLLKVINNEQGWHGDVSRLLNTIATEPRFRRAMGLPDGWQEHPLWD